MFGKGFLGFFKSRRKVRRALADDAKSSLTDDRQIPSKESFDTGATQVTVLEKDSRPSTLQQVNGQASITRIDSLLGKPPRHEVSRNLHDLLENNKEWSYQKRRADPDYFKRLSSVQQQPHYLWIGCSDSRVPANQIVNMPPGEIFVHRNVANLVNADDRNALSVIQYAVQNLRVKHIIVCGHTCCGGVRACLGPQLTDPLEKWLCPLRTLRETFATEIAAFPDEESQWRFLCEQNVRAQINVLKNLPIVQQAWEANQPLALHGWLYSMDEGLLRDLDVTVDGGSFPRGSVDTPPGTMGKEDIPEVDESAFESPAIPPHAAFDRIDISLLPEVTAVAASS